MRSKAMAGPRGHNDEDVARFLDAQSSHRKSVSSLEACHARVPDSVRDSRRKKGLPIDLDPGYCYLSAVRSDSWDKACEALGFNPYLLIVWAWLQDNVGLWSGGRFSLSFGAYAPIGGDGRAYVQAHLAPSTCGLTHKELLTHTAYQVRLGGDVQRPTSDQTDFGAPSQRTVAAPAHHPTVTLPFFATLKANQSCSFSPRANATVQGLTKYFESAELVSLSATLSIGGGEQVSVLVGCGTGKHAPADADGYLSLPLCSVFSGSAQSTATGAFELPPNHGFGREVKAVAVGNPDPVLHVLVDSEVPTVVLLRGVVTLRLTGVGVPAPIRVSANK